MRIGPTSGRMLWLAYMVCAAVLATWFFVERRELYGAVWSVVAVTAAVVVRQKSADA